MAAAIGVFVALLIFARRNGLNWMRVDDYLCCVAPIGLFFGRLANFVNGELWGKATDVPWAIVFPNGGDVPRHPSQLYEAGLEGMALFAHPQPPVLAHRCALPSRATWGASSSAATACSASSSSSSASPTPSSRTSSRITHLHMGQWLCVPMILVGLYCVITAKGRRQRVEPIAGSAPVA